MGRSPASVVHSASHEKVPSVGAEVPSVSSLVVSEPPQLTRTVMSDKDATIRVSFLMVRCLHMLGEICAYVRTCLVIVDEIQSLFT